MIEPCRCEIKNCEIQNVAWRIPQHLPKPSFATYKTTKNKIPPVIDNETQSNNYKQEEKMTANYTPPETTSNHEHYTTHKRKEAKGHNQKLTIGQTIATQDVPRQLKRQEPPNIPKAK